MDNWDDDSEWSPKTIRPKPPVDRTPAAVREYLEFMKELQAKKKAKKK